MVSNHLYNIIKNSPVGVGILNFLFGLLVGHWLAIGRDRRKEFNRAALPIREALLQQLHGLPQKRYRPDAVSNDQFVAFGVFVRPTSKNRYFRYVEKYQQCFELNQYPDVHGHPSWNVKNSDFASLETATKRLLKYCKLK